MQISVWFDHLETWSKLCWTGTAGICTPPCSVFPHRAHWTREITPAKLWTGACNNASRFTSRSLHHPLSPSAPWVSLSPRLVRCSIGKINQSKIKVDKTSVLAFLSFSSEFKCILDCKLYIFKKNILSFLKLLSNKDLKIWELCH